MIISYTFVERHPNFLYLHFNKAYCNYVLNCFLCLCEKLLDWVHLVLVNNKCGSSCTINVLLNTRSLVQWNFFFFHQSCLKLLSRFVWPLKRLDFPSGMSHCNENLWMFSFLVELAIYLFIVYILPFLVYDSELQPRLYNPPLFSLGRGNSDLIKKWPWGENQDRHC